MSKHKMSENYFTQAVKSLAARIEQYSGKQSSLYKHASLLFESHQIEHQAIQNKQSNLGADNLARGNPYGPYHRNFLKEKLEEKLQDNYAEWCAVCEEIYTLVGAASPERRQQKCARLMSTILLLSRWERDKPMFQAGRHLYRATLSILLLDHMLSQGLIKNSYVLKYAEQRIEGPKTYSDNNDNDDIVDATCPFKTHIQIPMIMASLLQEVGTIHPEIRALNKALEQETDLCPTKRRKMTVRIDQEAYGFTLNYLAEGIEAGNQPLNRLCRKQHQQAEENKEKFKFIRTLLHCAAFKPGTVGDLLRLPQMYTNLLMSPACHYDNIPKITRVICDRARRGLVGKDAVTSLETILGYFPPGYGIAYIPKCGEEKDQDRYEFAIVTSLYPASPKHPRCRAVTRNLTYSAVGQDMIIAKENNLYFRFARKKLERVPEKRLREILALLYFDASRRMMVSSLIPSFWLPYEYFAYSRHQNLWGNTLNELTAA